MKKFISFALAASMVISMVPATAFASSDLSTSHSNIRTTSNSEFVPKSVADADSTIVYREIPYILLEAKSNFNNAEQTFELALENAEWLEADGRNSDKLYMELKDIMTNPDDGIKIEPDGYNPNAKPDEPTTPTDPTTPSTPSDTVESTEKAYRAAVDTLLEARKAYNDASKNAAAYKEARAERDAAQTAKDTADEAVKIAQDKLDAAKKQYEDAQNAEAAYQEAITVRGTSKYINALNDTLIYSSVVAKTSISDIYVTADEDENGNYIWNSTYTVGDGVYASADDVDTDPALATNVLTESSIYYAADETDSAAAAGDDLYYVQLSSKGIQELQGTEGNWTSISAAVSGLDFTPNTIIKISGAITCVSASDDGKLLLTTEAQVAEGITGEFIELNARGEIRQAANISRVSAAKAALEYLEEIESSTGAIAEADKLRKEAAAHMPGYEKAIKDAEDALKTAQEAAAEAQAELDKKQAALDAAGASASEAAAADKALTEAIKAREEAAIRYMGAYKNASGNPSDSTLGAAINTIDSGKNIKSGDADYKTDAQWGTIYRDSDRSGKSAVAEQFEAEILGTTTKVNVDIQKKSDTRIVVTTSGYKFRNGDILKIPMFVRTTGGIAKISIDSLDSEFTSEGKTFARTSDGDTKLSIEKVQNFYDSDEIKNLYIEELVPGTLEQGKYISLRVNGDFQLRRGANFKITQITGDSFAGTGGEWTDVYTNTRDGVRFEQGDKADEIYIRVPNGVSTKAVQLRIEGLQIAEDGADFGDEATLTVSGAGTSKETITIGTYEDYGVKLTAEDKDLPVIYAGTRASSKYDNQTLKVTIEETVANSFINNRKMELTLPDGVEFVVDNDSQDELDGTIDQITEDFKLTNFSGTDTTVKKAFTVDKDGGKITINSRDLGNASEAFDSSGSNKDRRRKIEFSVHVAAAADFTGDVVMTLSGAAVADREMSATIATVKAPIEVKTDVNELKIDYRNTNIADITLVEPEAGLWAKSDEIYLQGERMSFEDDAVAEVVSGDMKLDKLGGNYVDTSDDDDSALYIKVDSRSSKTPAEIKISNLSLYMGRSLAAGDYKLKVFGSDDNEFFMNNYLKDGDDYPNAFETEKVTVMSDFVKVVTAGREQDDSTFTTQVVVPIGSDVIQAGSREIKLSEMAGGACPSAYINNDGYTMLPVRAVTEALNGIAIVRWDDATKTCTVSFGQRVFSMTVGSKVLNMNGVSTALNAAPEIKDSRVFLPLRDLGYALGLSESQISWDATTQTARLN